MTTHYLNLSGHGGHRWDGADTDRVQTRSWIQHLEASLQKPLDASNPLAVLKRQGQERLLQNLRRDLKAFSKRPKRQLRRPNPKSLQHVEQAMRQACLEQAARNKCTGALVFYKAQMASLLNVPEHFVAQVAHLWNRKGLCRQAVNLPPHDSHRDRSFPSYWTSAWRDTTYEVDLDKLLLHAG